MVHKSEADSLPLACTLSPIFPYFAFLRACYRFTHRISHSHITFSLFFFQIDGDMRSNFSLSTLEFILYTVMRSQQWTTKFVGKKIEQHNTKTKLSCFVYILSWSLITFLCLPFLKPLITRNALRLRTNCPLSTV